MHDGDGAPHPGAPNVVFTDPTGREISLRDVRGRPALVAFAPRLPFGATDEDFLRAELRGLGAALVVVTPDAVWLVEPDDPVVAIEPVHEWHVPARLFAVFRVDPERTTLLVVGDGGEILWRSETPELLEAIGRAAAVKQGGTGGLLVSRRDVLVSALVGAAVALLLPHLARARPAGTSSSGPTGDIARVTLDVNGQKRTVEIEPRVTLLDLLREVLGLTGTKKGCDHGQCGACTVLVDGRRTLSCMTLAIMQEGAKVKTIEGLAEGDRLHPVQAAFVKHDAYQCGFCTPGQIMSAVGLLAEGRVKSADEIREAMSGNICRCGAYPNIVAAIDEVRKA